MMKGKKYDNFLIKGIMFFAKSIVPQFVHECPYLPGEYKVVDIFVPRRLLVLVPSFIGKGYGQVFEGKLQVGSGGGAIEVY